MITEQQLKADCTPEIIKKMVELAEGFECAKEDPYYLAIYFKGIEVNPNSLLVFSTLIHRAVEGWNKKHTDGFDSITIDTEMVNILINKYPMPDFKAWHFKNYSPSFLTHAECAMLHCLQEVLK